VHHHNTTNLLPAPAGFFRFTGYPMPIGEQIAEIARSDVAASAAKSAFPVSVAGMHWLGLQLSDWVMITAIIYTVLQIIFLLKDRLFSRGKHKRSNR
jgi:hypothetical protein